MKLNGMLSAHLPGVSQKQPRNRYLKAGLLAGMLMAAPMAAQADSVSLNKLNLDAPVQPLSPEQATQANNQVASVALERMYITEDLLREAQGLLYSLPIDPEKGRGALESFEKGMERVTALRKEMDLQAITPHGITLLGSMPADRAGEMYFEEYRRALVSTYTDFARIARMAMTPEDRASARFGTDGLPTDLSLLPAELYPEVSYMRQRVELLIPFAEQAYQSYQDAMAGASPTMPDWGNAMEVVKSTIGR